MSNTKKPPERAAFNINYLNYCILALPLSQSIHSHQPKYAMLPQILEYQNAFVEITNPIHGGKGWEVGTCLWTSVYDKRGKEFWKSLKEIREGDLILHLVKIKDNKTKRFRHHWIGISIASSSVFLSEEEPPQKPKNDRGAPYQRINLKNFVPFSRPLLIDDFFIEYKKKLREYSEENKFYSHSNRKIPWQVAQNYVLPCSKEVYNLFSDFSIKHNISIVWGEQNILPTATEPSYPDLASPGRVDTIISRIIRDTILSRELKREYKWKCQICGLSIPLPNGNKFIEAHHLIPLGGSHQGPDTKTNMILLCPNHHSEFDYGSIAINPTTNKVEHLQLTNTFNNKSLAYAREDLSKESIEYHYRNIFKK